MCLQVTEQDFYVTLGAGSCLYSVYKNPSSLQDIMLLNYLTTQAGKFSGSDRVYSASLFFFCGTAASIPSVIIVHSFRHLTLDDPVASLSGLALGSVVFIMVYKKLIRNV